MNIGLDIVGKQYMNNIKSESIGIQEDSTKGPGISSITSKIKNETAKAKKDIGKLDRSIEAFFIGPRGENINFFKELIEMAIDSHYSARVEYELEDARHISRRMKNEPSFLDAQDRLERALNVVLAKMKELTPPFFSSRYFGHMIWETTIPGIVGNFATLLYNPNNCAFEGGPFTTLLEIQVIKEFAIMFGYPKMLEFQKQKNPEQNFSWGHLTCGGTIANCEAMWAARNCRFLSLSIRKYIESLEKNNGHIKDIKVKLCTGESKKLLSLSAWELLNVNNDETMQLYDRAFQTLYPHSLDNPQSYKTYQDGVAAFSIGKLGILDMYDWLEEINETHPEKEWKKRIPRPKVFASATYHYSIKKSLSILGLGEKAAEGVYVDLDSRISIPALTKKLTHCLENKIPVLSVIGIVGTTEESTVDNLAEIYRLKEQFMKKGLYFHFHIDGAYGGYFVSMIRQRKPEHWNSFSQYVETQLLTFCKSDSITFDPHKTGYVPYTCGGIIYRNHRLRDNLSFSAPYIYTGAEPNMAIYGVEGSKPGSSVTSVYLSLQVLPLVRRGHGELLERTMMNTKIFSASLYRVKEIGIEYKHDKGIIRQNFNCLMLPRLFCQKQSKPELLEAEMKCIQKISDASPTELEELVSSETNTYELFDDIYYNLGPDLNIVCYGLNFKVKEGGQWNRSLKEYNRFNRTLIKLSKPVGNDISVKMKDLYVSETEINRHTYGEEIFKDFLKRHNLEEDDDELVLIRSTIMNAFFIETTECEKSENKIKSSNRLFVSELIENGCETLLYLNLR